VSAPTLAPSRYPGIPILGSLLEARENPLAMFERASKLGDVVEFAFLRERGFLLNHPDLLEHVLHQNTKGYAKQTRGYKALRKVLGNGLLTSDGSFWLRQRRLAQPAFHKERINGFGAAMVKSAQEMLDGWLPLLESGNPFDVHEEMMKLTLKVVGQTLLSADVTGAASEIGDALNRVIRLLMATTTQFVDLPEWVPTSANRELVQARGTLDTVVQRIIAERRQRGAGDDLLGLFMAAKDAETGESMSDEQLRDEVMTMLLAGHETTANGLTWALYLLAQSPDAEKKLREEHATALGGKPPTTAVVHSLKYTLGVVNEALRLYPPAWIVARRALADDRVGPASIPKGALVFMLPFLIHRRPDLWPEPLAFKPERWVGTDGHAPVTARCGWIPFSTGQRKCIGDTFAVLEMQLILATMLQRVRFSLAPGHPVVPEPMVTLRPKHGLWMTVRPLAGERPSSKRAALNR
jgi:cytochrome P450